MPDQSSNTPSGPSVTHTEELEDRFDWVSIQRFRVRVMAGAAPTEVVSDGEELSIGSAAGNDLIIDDTAVSRHHCTITSAKITGGDDGFLLRDLHSTNGTRVSGFRVRATFLKPGTVFKVGRTTLQFDPLEETVNAPISTDHHHGTMVGSSEAMRRLFAMIKRVARAESTVLIEGETGTGKTALADAIHQDSARREGPFVVVDCASIAPNLIESHLFGHVAGAFTGAAGERTGAFAAAKGGTVFLDEVGELPLEVQPKLLRVLEERVVVPLGSVQEVPIDVRVVAATNRDLRREVNEGTFRADLFYRLHVVRMTMPPLRERREDIPPLIEHFRRQIAPDSPPPPAAMIETWQRLHWSGNARELRSAVERYLLLGDDAWQTAARSSDAMAPFNPELSFRAAKEIAVAQFEKGYLGMLIDRHGGNLSKAARAASMDRNHLRQLLRRHEIAIKRSQ